MNPNKPDIEGLSDYVGVRGADPNLCAEGKQEVKL